MASATSALKRNSTRPDQASPRGLRGRPRWRVVDRRGGGRDVHRDATFATGFGPTWSNPGDSAANIAWCQAYDAALRQHSMQGGYVNFTAADDQHRVPNNYRRNYDRLVAIKRHYDPDNLFRLNHNIVP